MSAEEARSGARPLIELSGITKIYGEGNARLEALRGIDLSNQKRLMVCRFSAVARQTRLDACVQIF